MIMNRLMKLMMVLILMFTMACAQNAEPQKKELDDDIYIFYTSDVHCGVDENLSYAKLKALINDTKEEHKYTALVDLGDYLQGGTLGSLSRGSIIIDLMNAMGYDAATLGNHEFDYGTERLGEMMKAADFDITVCNIEYTGTKENIFKDTPSYVMKDFNGVKVAFVGASTPYTLIQSTPAYFMEDNQFVYDFSFGDDGKKLAEKVQSAADEARKNGADYVIVIAHLGSIESLSPYDSISLIHNTRGIDAVLDGHSHSVIIGDRYPNADGEDVLLSSVGTKMQNAGELIIGKDGTLDSLLISEYNREDEEMRKAIDQANADLEAILSEKVGELEFDLTIAGENGLRLARSRETTAGNFVADAFRKAADTDIAVMNGGAVRSAIHAGDVTFQDLLNVMPFSNSLAACRCTGQQILDMLEYCSKEVLGITEFDGKAVGEFGGFLQVSGLKYTIDTSIEPSVVQDDNGTFAGSEGDRRVKDVYVLENGEYVPIDPEKTYTVSSTDYAIFNGGDGNCVLKDCEPVIKDGMPDISVLIQYFNDPDTDFSIYKETEGRITVK